MTKKINRSVLIISIVLLQLTLFVYGKVSDGVKETDRIKNVKQENVSFQKPHRQIVSNWEFKETTSSKWLKAKVPGCVHSDLLRNKKIPDPYFGQNEKELQWIDKKDWQYHNVFTVTNEEAHSKVISLRFEGLDTYASVYLNDKLILEADNMFRTWNVDVRNEIKTGKNELLIYFHSPIIKGLQKMKEYGFGLPADNDQAVLGGLSAEQKVSPFIRKAPYHFGWDWGPRFVTSGIYKPIYFITKNQSDITDVFYRQDEVSSSKAKITTIVTVDGVIPDSGQIIVKDKTTKKILAVKMIEIKKGNNDYSIPIEISNPRLWWSNGLGKPNLYEFETSLQINQKIVSKNQTRIGLRSVKVIEKPENGGFTMFIELNGIPVFMKGANHIPNDLFVDRLTKSVYDKEIDDAAKANMNMIRVWGGGIYESDDFYNACDENGILVWNDFNFSVSMYPGNKAFLESVKAEAIDFVKRVRNHPSIALWCGNNEIDYAWQQNYEKGGWFKQRYSSEQRTIIWKAYQDIFLNILPNVVKEYDGTRAYRHSSPCRPLENEHAGRSTLNDGDMHYWNIWSGEHKPFENYEEVLGRFMSEYGIQSMPEMKTISEFALQQDFSIESDVMKAHQKHRIGFDRLKYYIDYYYKTPTKFKNLVYLSQVMQAEGIRKAIEAHRANMPHTMGTLYWQLNDVWPVVSWSSTDYYHRWKALHYQVKRSFEPVMITAKRVKDSIVVNIVSDKMENITDINFTARVIDAKGNAFWNIKKNVTASANTSTVLLKEAVNTLNPPKNSFILVEATKNGNVIASNTYFFDKINEMQLPVPSIELSVKPDGDKYTITVSANVLTKNLHLYLDNIEGIFSDNFFDVLPNQAVSLTFTPKQKTTLTKIKTEIKYNHLQNAMNN